MASRAAHGMETGIFSVIKELYDDDRNSTGINYGLALFRKAARFIQARIRGLSGFYVRVVLGSGTWCRWLLNVGVQRFWRLRDWVCQVEPSRPQNSGKNM